MAANDPVYMQHAGLSGTAGPVPRWSFDAKWSLEGWSEVAAPTGGAAPFAQDPGNLTDLLGWTLAQAFRLTGTPTLDLATGAYLSFAVTWPDGGTGIFTTDSQSSSFPGAIDGFHITYTSPGGTVARTITQPAVTRDGTTGRVTAQPALTVA